jgi:YYY domain-containing protein
VYVVSFLAVVLILAAAGTAILGVVFERDEPEPALGAAFGVLLHAYLLFLLCSVGLLRNGFAAAALALGLVLAAAWALDGLGWWHRALRRFRLRSLCSLALLVGLYLAYCWVRSRNPQIWGEEKFMDFAFLNGIWRSEAFPPNDPWFAGGTINYYYFGYLMAAGLSQLSAVPPAFAYNLALALWFSTSVAAAFELGTAFTGRMRHGLLAAVLMGIAGNLEGALQLLGGRVRDFNYFQSSRVIEFTINEFPFFSFIHADLHPHVLSIPLVLLVLFVLLQACLRPELLFGQRPLQRPLLLRFALLALLLGAVPCTNMADLPTLYGLVAIAGAVAAYRAGSRQPAPERHSLVPGLAALCAAFLVGYILFLPFHREFEPAQVRGIGLVQRRSPLVDFLIIHGLFFYVVVTDLFTRPGPLDPARPWRAREPVLLALAVLVTVTSLLLDTLTVGLLAAVLAALLLPVFGAARARPPRQDFHDLLLLVAFGLLLGCEIVFVRDFYGGDYERHNTVFKFYYQAWILLAFATAQSLADLSSRFAGSPSRRAWAAGFVLLLAATLVYPVLGTRARYFTHPAAGTLYGMDHLVRHHPDEHAAMLLLQRDAPRDARLLEMPGPPYQYYGRFSANTGIPTVMGWIQHEAFWRDNTYAIPNRRAEEVRRIYSAPAFTDEVRKLLDDYRIRYIVVGELERKDAPASGLAKFEQLPAAFPAQGQVSVYLWRPLD